MKGKLKRSYLMSHWARKNKGHGGKAGFRWGIYDFGRIFQISHSLLFFLFLSFTCSLRLLSFSLSLFSLSSSILLPIRVFGMVIENIDRYPPEPFC